MIVTIHQPAYLPWLGYLDRIASSDVFVFLDSVQFEKNSFTNRNRIKTPKGPLWLTVPVKLQGHLQKVLSEIEVDDKQNWKKKHLRSIEQNYRQASAFNDIERLAALYDPDVSLLSDLCFDQLKFWLTELGIKSRVVRASELAVEGKKSDLILTLCRKVGGDTYLSGPLGRGYLEEEKFAAAGITVRYHDYVHPTYPQLFGEFLPAMGVADYWLNCPERDLFRKKQ